MGKVDPNDDKFKDQDRTKWVTAGRRLFLACGKERYDSVKQGTKMISVRFVCVADPDADDEHPSEVGHCTGLDFVADSESKGIVFLVKFLRDGGLNPKNESFDTDSDEEMNAILTRSFVWLTTEQAGEYRGKPTFRTEKESVEPWSGEPEVKDEEEPLASILGHAIDQFDKYMEWRQQPGNSRAEKAADRGSKGDGGRGRGFGGRGGGGGGGKSGGGTGGGGAPDVDEEIPFVRCVDAHDFDPERAVWRFRD